MKEQTFANSPIVILGAARSGTKMLRALVASQQEMYAVPYDVNYIWKYGNQSLPHDALDPATLKPRITRFIRRQLMRCSGMSSFDSGSLVEKTVGNILRIPFVSAVLPNARYLVLVRDGRDVIESARRCWQERPNLSYLLKKCRTFPWTSCMSYGVGFAASTIKRLATWSRKPPAWGPLYPGIHDHVAELELLEVCAYQWRSSMDRYELYRDSIPIDHRLEIRYEQLVNDPKHEVDRLADFLEISPRSLQAHAAETIRADNVGKHSKLTSDELNTIERIAGSTLSRWGYDCHSSPRNFEQTTLARAA